MSRASRSARSLRKVSRGPVGTRRVSDDLEHEVLTLVDPTRGRYGKVVVRHDRLVGAVSLGNPDTTGLLSQLFDSQTTVPSDRISLLLGHARAPTAQTRPEDLPDTAVICRCNAVTKNQIIDSWTAGHRTGPGGDRPDPGHHRVRQLCRHRPRTVHDAHAYA